jgi:hypothetical protein
VHGRPPPWRSRRADRLSSAFLQSLSNGRIIQHVCNYCELDRRPTCPLWVISGHSGPSTVMSALPPKSTFVGASVMSAMGQKRTLLRGLDEFKAPWAGPASQFAMRASALRFFRINNRDDPPRAIKPDVCIRMITRLIVSMVSPR